MEIASIQTIFYPRGMFILDPLHRNIFSKSFSPSHHFFHPSLSSRATKRGSESMSFGSPRVMGSTPSFFPLPSNALCISPNNNTGVPRGTDTPQRSSQGSDHAWKMTPPSMCERGMLRLDVFTWKKQPLIARFWFACILLPSMGISCDETSISVRFLRHVKNFTDLKALMSEKMLLTLNCLMHSAKMPPTSLSDCGPPLNPWKFKNF